MEGHILWHHLYERAFNSWPNHILRISRKRPPSLSYHFHENRSNQFPVKYWWRSLKTLLDPRVVSYSRIICIFSLSTSMAIPVTCWALCLCPLQYNKTTAAGIQTGKGTDWNMTILNRLTWEETTCWGSISSKFNVRTTESLETLTIYEEVLLPKQGSFQLSLWWDLKTKARILNIIENKSILSKITQNSGSS